MTIKELVALIKEKEHLEEVLDAQENNMQFSRYLYLQRILEIDNTEVTEGKQKP